MKDSRRRIVSLLSTLALGAANLVAFNLLLRESGGLRVDLTDDRRYSISPATRRLLSGLEEDVRIRGYFSRRTHPKLAPLVPELRDLLEEYRAIGGGHVRVDVLDPSAADETAREAADRFGVESTPFRLASKYEAGIVNAYFALVVQYGDRYVRYGFDDLIEVEPLPDGDLDVRLGNLEYELTRGIKRAVHEFRGAAELFERVREPLRFTAVLSPKTLPESVGGVPEAVRAAAEELEAAGGERFEYVEVDPSTDPAIAEQVLRDWGAPPMALGILGDAPFWLYAFVEIGSRTEQVDLAGEAISAARVREAVEEVLRRNTPGFLKTVGLVRPAPHIPPELLMQLQMSGGMPQPPPPDFEQLRRYLSRDYRVVEVDLESKRGIPSDVDVLLVVDPRELPASAVYRIDRYVMTGGRLVICGGRFDVELGASGIDVRPVSTGLEEWLGEKGVTIEPTLVLDDRNQPLPLPEYVSTPLGTLRTWRLVPYPYLVEVRDDGLVQREVAAGLTAVGIYWGSPLTVAPALPDGIEAIELLRSSPLSWADDDLAAVERTEYAVPADTAFRILGVVLNGTFRSAWSGEEPPDLPEGALDPAVAAILERSPETRIAVIGNGKMLSDFVAQVLGLQEGGFFSENLAYLQNLIDWMTLDSDMIAIRSRSAGARRLARVDEAIEAAVESAAYALPVVVLLALAVWRGWRRRGIAPAVGGAGERRP